MAVVSGSIAATICVMKAWAWYKVYRTAKKAHKVLRFGSAAFKVVTHSKNSVTLLHKTGKQIVVKGVTSGSGGSVQVTAQGLKGAQVTPTIINDLRQLMVAASHDLFGVTAGMTKAQVAERIVVGVLF